MNTQEICKALGDYGCYFLSLLHLTNSEYGALSLFTTCLDKGYIDKECYIYNPPAILKMATGSTYEVRKEPLTYKPKDDELIIIRYERVTPGTTYAHFVVGDSQGNVAYDPLGNSNTVAFGKPVSYRIVRKL